MITELMEEDIGLDNAIQMVDEHHENHLSLKSNIESLLQDMMKNEEKKEGDSQNLNESNQENTMSPQSEVRIIGEE